MPFAIKAQIDGLEDLLKALQSLSRKAAKKILRDAVKASAQIVTKAAKQNCPTGDTGLLKKSLGWKVKTYPNGTVVGVVGPRTGWKKTKQGKARTALGRKYQDAGVNPVLYAHLVEFGRRAVSAKEAKVLTDGGTFFGKHVAAVPARPFLRPALDNNLGRVRAAMGEKIRAGVAREAGKTDDGGGAAAEESGD